MDKKYTLQKDKDAALINQIIKICNSAFIRSVRDFNMYNVYMESMKKFINKSTSNVITYAFKKVQDNIEKGIHYPISIDEYVTICTNERIRVFLDKDGTMNLALMNIGLKTFNIVCKSILGDNFIEESINDIPQNHNIPIEEFIKIYGHNMKEIGKINHIDLSNEMDLFDILPR